MLCLNEVLNARRAVIPHMALRLARLWAIATVLAEPADRG
jgi:plasmid maintenance system antidote protein VapI